MRWYQQLKNIYHWLQAQGWRAVYRWPDRELTMYAVTGTNGKTTTAILFGSILRAVHGREKAGLLTTIMFWFGATEVVNETKMTTLPSKMVYQHLRRMADAGVRHVVLEVTSHALDQHRLAGLRFAGAILLNIAREHLDYHRTMDEYAAAKGKIVGYLASDAPLIAKQDDQWVQAALAKQGHANIRRFTAEEARTVRTPLAGEVNKENVLAARMLAEAVGLPPAAIEQALASVRQIPGRMEWVELGADVPRVLIDYAVTPDALEKLYADMRQKTSGKLFAVLGACGLRDRGKRPDMARVVAKYADELVLTREDPWTESEEQIFQDLERGLMDADPVAAGTLSPLTSVPLPPSADGAPRNSDRGEPSRRAIRSFKWRRIVDRREAIHYCLQKAGPNDVVVVTGKGAETGMAMGTTIIPWSDKKVIQELLYDLQEKRGV